jgi:hypothetical protein
MKNNAVVLMLGTKIVAIFNGKENQFFHTSEHDLANKNYRLFLDYVLVDDPVGMKRSDIFYYWKTTKRGRIYRPTPQRVGNVTSVVPGFNN